ncbi:MAG: cell cycle transcriptional regulator TrcR [Pseudomonadota bacterium]
MPQPLMPKATAVWLVDNTTLTFDQIAEFVGMHPLEISGIADGEVAVGIKGFDPIANNQLTREEIERCEQDGKRRLNLKPRISTPEPKKKAPRYTPLSKRQDRPAAIAWLVRNHPELADSQISKLLGTTKATIQAIRDKTHWNSANIQPVDPVALGLCRQVDLDAAVGKAAARKAKEAAANGEPVSEEPGLMSTEESLAPEPVAATVKGAFEGLESFDVDAARSRPPATEEAAADAAAALFGDDAPVAEAEDEEKDAPVDAEAFFNLPEGGATKDGEPESDKP